MAFESFSLSCEIQEAQIEALNGTIEQRTDLASAKFIMACRQFQKGLAYFAILRKAFSNRDLLDADQQFFETHANAENNFPSDLDLKAQMDFDEMLEDRIQQNENYQEANDG